MRLPNETVERMAADGLLSQNRTQEAAAIADFGR
jgi:hypothetical protein